MHRLARTSLLALALALPACSDSSGPDGLTLFGCDKGMRYAIAQTVTGSITTSDCTDPDGQARADFYQFRLTASGPVSIVVARSGGSGTMYVAILGAGEELVDIAAVEPGEQVAVGGQLNEGTYVIAIGGEVPGQSNYTLSSSATLPPSGPPFFNCTVVQPHTLGTTVNGTLSSGDCVTPDLAWMDRYQLTLPAARTVTIDLTSTDFDAYLFLFNAEGTVIARNDDNDSSYDSRISLSLPAGSYSIGATSYDANVGGSYTLRTQ